MACMVLCNMHVFKSRVQEVGQHRARYRRKFQQPDEWMVLWYRWSSELVTSRFGMQNSWVSACDHVANNCSRWQWCCMSWCMEWVLVVSTTNLAKRMNNPLPIMVSINGCSQHYWIWCNSDRSICLWSLSGWLWRYSFSNTCVLFKLWFHYVFVKASTWPNNTYWTHTAQVHFTTNSHKLSKSPLLCHQAQFLNCKWKLTFTMCLSFNGYLGILQILGKKVLVFIIWMRQFTLLVISTPSWLQHSDKGKNENDVAWWIQFTNFLCEERLYITLGCSHVM